MNAFEKIVNFLNGKMTTPTNYGWFHLLFVGIVIAAAVLLCIFFKNCNDRVFRRIVLISWAVVFALEIYKQVVFAFIYDGVAVTWDYAWYAFPYQLCSTPLYVLPFIFLMKDSKLRDCFISYMSFFSLFAGVAVFFYPNDVFTATTGINIQTMIHHGTQIVLGVFFVVRKRDSFNLKLYVKSVPVFAILVSIAVFLNEIVYSAFASKGIEETFNMFYISRHYGCTLPILSEIYKVIPYAAFVLIYFFGFIVVSFIIFLICKLILTLVERARGYAE